jgi:hypothetical protein
MTEHLRIVWAALALALVVGPITACGGAGDVQIHSATDPHADFSRYRRWAYGGREAIPEGFARLELPTMERERLRDMVRQELAAKGLTEGTFNNADVIFFAGLGQRSEALIQRAERTYREDGTYEDTIRDSERRATEDTLVVDGFERPSMYHVFHAHATVPNIRDDVEATERALRAIIAEFPASDPNAPPHSSGGEVPADETQGEGAPAGEGSSEGTDPAAADAPAAEEAPADEPTVVE